MIGKKTMVKVVMALALGSMVIANGSMAFAQSTKSTKSAKSGSHVQCFNKINMNTKFKTLLDSLVTAGTITSDQETAVIKAFTPSDSSNKYRDFKGKGGLKAKLDALVAAGTITSDEETAIQDALKPAKGQKFNVKTQLDALVTAATITSDQETAIVKAFTPSDNSNKCRDFKGKGGLKAKLDALVAAGTITSDQETAILNLVTTNIKTSSQVNQ